MTVKSGPALVRNLPVHQRLELAAIGIGALTFIWGFLDWWGAPTGSQNGYRLGDGYLPIAIILTASLVASINLRAADRNERTALLAIGLSGLGVLFTIVAMAVKPALVTFVEELANQVANANVSISMQIGLILTLVSALLQFAGLIASWLLATGRMPKKETASTEPSEPGPPPPTSGWPESDGQ